jgi:hypothetical protein
LLRLEQLFRDGTRPLFIDQVVSKIVMKLTPKMKSDEEERCKEFIDHFHFLKIIEEKYSGALIS